MEEAEQAMHMIGHYDIFINDGVGEMIGYFAPTAVGNKPGLIQDHPTIDHGSKFRDHVLGANGNEIPAGAGEIPTLHPQMLRMGHGMP